MFSRNKVDGGYEVGSVTPKLATAVIPADADLLCPPRARMQGRDELRQQSTCVPVEVWQPERTLFSVTHYSGPGTMGCCCC